MTRTRLRMILVLAGILPTLVALLFAVKVVAMLSHDRDGRGQFDDADYLAAADEFSANGSVNWFEPWISAFDEGAARHAEGDLEGALERYAAALEDVPAEEECTVRINIALADETLGDTALEEGDADEATGWWQAGIDALAEGDCPTDSGRGEDQTQDAADVDQRLRDKLQQQQQQQGAAAARTAGRRGADPRGAPRAARAGAQGARARGAQRGRHRGGAEPRGEQPGPRLLAVPLVTPAK